MGQMLCPVLIGRAEESALVLRAVDRAVDRRGSTTLLLGEAGVGKSRLAHEVIRVARERGLTVLVGRAVGGAVPEALRPLSEAVLGVLRNRGELDTPELRAFWPALARLVPLRLPAGTTGPAESPPGTAGPVESGVVLAEGLLRLLSRLASDQACLLVLEDLHWADPETLDVLEYLADNIATEPIAVLATLRSGEAGPGTTQLTALTGRRAANPVVLAKLDDADVLRVARACLHTGGLPAPLARFLTTHADGLPFLVEELLAGLVADRVLVESDGTWSLAGDLNWRLPPAFATEVDRRMAQLSPEAGLVLHAAATLGRRFDWPLLVEATGLSTEQVLAALRAAVGAQLVTAGDGGFAFRHALTRDAVLAGLIPPDRAGLAGRLLEAVERTYPGLPGQWCEAAAVLAEQARQPRRSAELLLEAGRRAIVRGALSSGEALLRRARTLASDDVDLPARIDETLTEVLALAGRVDDALELGDGLLARADLRSRLRSDGVELRLRLARAAIGSARWEAAATHLAAARGTARTDELAGRVDALAAQVALGTGDLESAGSLAASALRTAGRESLPELACEALEVAGRVARQQDLEAAESAFARELATAVAADLRLWRVRALHELGTVDQLRTESVGRLEEARELASDIGAVGLVATLDLQIAAGLLKQFRAEEGLIAADRSVGASARLGLATLPMALVLQATAHAQAGRTIEREDCLARAWALAPTDPDVVGSSWGHCRAVAALLDEDRRAAIAQMTKGAELLLATPTGVAPPFLGLRVLLLALDGEEAAVRAAADQVRASGATRHRIVGSLLEYAEAVLLGRAGRPADARAAFEAADSDMGALVAWYRHYARRLVAESALVHGWGDPVAWLREAAVYFADRDDRRIAAACRALLRRAGVPVPRARRADALVPSALRAVGVTSREAEVGGLLAGGLTNAEIGERLFLSPRTVEKHVAALLLKTGCRGRTMLAGEWARLTG